MRKAIHLVLVAMLSAAAANAQQRNAFAPVSFEHYDVLVENNIFLRERGRRPEPAQRPPERAPEPSPEQSFVLTGIVFEQGEFRAYFESRRGGPPQRLGPGAAIAGGAISRILIDAVEYASDDGLRWIEIGQDLTGGALRAGAAPGSAAASPAAGSTGAATSVEERLRQRRLQEMNGN